MYKRQPLDYAAEFSTEMCPEGVVAVSGEKLRIFGVERLGEVFNQAALPLRSAATRVPGAVNHYCYASIMAVRNKLLYLVPYDSMLRML